MGAGLAGSECAYQLAKGGIKVVLVEMRPQKNTPAHHTDKPAELVCSNSFRGVDVKNAVGLLKEEMAKTDSLIMQSAQKAQVPAGGALAVDRDVFSDEVKARLLSFENLTYRVDVVQGFERQPQGFLVICESGQHIVCDRVVVATGPLTDATLANWIRGQTGREHLYFYDAIAPIVEVDSIDMNVAFRANRWGKSCIVDRRSSIEKGERCPEGDYINCPLNREEYEAFISAIKNAELIPVKEFDDPKFFDGCLPIEEMVRRGDDVLRFGPMKPVGLFIQGSRDRRVAGSQGHSFCVCDPALPRPREPFPHAVVQLRQDNLHDTLYNMVGFQTRMKYHEQERIFRMIPGLEKAQFVRLGSLHRNTFMCSPVLLDETCGLKTCPGIHFAGQITGCEGYVESSAMGLLVGAGLRHLLSGGKTRSLPPQTTALGALAHHVLHADPEQYQPMNVNFGLFAPLTDRCRKKAKKEMLVARARQDFDEWLTG